MLVILYLEISHLECKYQYSIYFSVISDEQAFCLLYSNPETPRINSCKITKIPIISLGGLYT